MKQINEILKGFARLAFLLIIISTVACKKSNTGIDDESPGMEHPRLLLGEGEEEQIKSLIETDDTWRKMHFAILDECNNISSQPALERELTGRRLLSKSRELLRRVFYLSYAYRMTEDERYLNRAEYEMLAVAGFSDWNPSHFLDVAEMTMGMAIGYDWLFNELSEESKKTIREAIVNKGINPSYNGDYNWFLEATHNWNQVCNAGMTFGALAIQEDQPELAQQTIDRAFETIHLPMEDYKPDGAYPEGYSYWGYGTSFNVMFLSAVEKALGTDKGLTESEGFLDTGGFLLHMLAPTGPSFNWGDCGTGSSLNPAMFWFAERNDNPSVLWSENRFLQTDDFSGFTGNRLLPAIMIWGKNIPLENIQPPSSTFWVGQGHNPVAMMRTSWTDSEAIYVGFKAGSPSVNHGHMDIGSFDMEANGVRWAADLGMQNYESLESKGMSIFGRTQDAERWTIFRLNNHSHSVLTIDDELQRVDGYAKIDKSSDETDFMTAVSDVSSVYNGQLKSATRGIAIKDEKYVVVRDELETLDKPTKVQWKMLTHADVVTGNREATLTSDGKKLLLKVLGPDNMEMKTWSTEPTNDYDAENPGSVLVGFECELPANANETFEVLLVPGDSEGTADFLNRKLENW